ncbi:MAG: hypothetical protein AB7Q29_08295 [Vicinamibacterales bacterium]
MSDPVKNPRDDQFVRRLQEEQSEAEDAGEFVDPHEADLEVEDDFDSSPENT